ncbi:MAG TPA: tetratricopeptide repeat protein [Vicinamibacteria bacterium]
MRGAVLLLAFMVATQDELATKSAAGKELMAAGRYAEAARVYRELVQALPGNPGLLLNLGMALHLSGQDREAVAPLEKALRLQPDAFPAALFLGASSLRLGRAAAAVAPLEKAVRLQPDNTDARSLLVQALLALDRPAAAEPHLRWLSERMPADPATWFNLGQAYEALEAQALDELVQRHPASAFALAAAAESRLRQRQRSAAFHLYRQAIERSPALRGLHAAVAEIYRSEGHADWAAVEEERERALPGPDCAREPLACRFAAGKYVDVIAAPDAKTAEASYWRSRAYRELAAQAFGRLGALPPSVQSHQRTAELRRSEQRYAESAEAWRRAIALAPEDPGLRLQLAVTLRLGQDFAGARQALEEMLKGAPDDPQANYLLGDVLLAEQQAEQAIPFLEKAVRLDPRQLHAHGALGRAYALVGRTGEAIPHLKQALAADDDGSLRYQLARAYQATGQDELARAALADYEAFRKKAAGPVEPITPP